MGWKIPFYNVLNMFLVGFVFIGFLLLIFYEQAYLFIASLNINLDGFGFETLITICIFALIYEIGFIINRIGSVIIEGFLVRAKLIPFNNDYKKFNDSKKKYPILEILSREYALSRNTFTLFLILTLISLKQFNWVYFGILLSICVLFFFSMRKHSTKIVKLME